MTDIVDTAALRECPFDCDNHGGKVVMRATRAGGLQVFCNSCNARGPVKGTTPDAIAAWNRRADDALVDDEAREAAQRILDYWGPDYGNEDEVIVARALLAKVKI